MVERQQKFHHNVGIKVFSQGFTLIELVIVIVMIGILAAFALPRFADMGKEARLAKLQSLESSVRTATSIVHSMALLESKTDCATNPTVKLEGKTVSLRCGYPCPHSSGIGNAVDTEGGYSWVGGNCGGQLGAIDVQISEASDPNNCKIRYTSARQNRPPGISMVTGGC